MKKNQDDININAKRDLFTKTFLNQTSFFLRLNQETEGKTFFFYGESYIFIADSI